MDRNEDALHQHQVDGTLLTHSHEMGALSHTHPTGIDEAATFNWYAIGDTDGNAGRDFNPPNDDPNDCDYLRYKDGYSDGKEDRDKPVDSSWSAEAAADTTRS